MWCIYCEEFHCLYFYECLDCLEDMLLCFTTIIVSLWDVLVGRFLIGLFLDCFGGLFPYSTVLGLFGGLLSCCIFSCMGHHLVDLFLGLFRFSIDCLVWVDTLFNYPLGCWSDPLLCLGCVEWLLLCMGCVSGRCCVWVM